VLLPDLLPVRMQDLMLLRSDLVLVRLQDVLLVEAHWPLDLLRLLG
jgi:hypothetical protein